MMSDSASTASLEDRVLMFLKRNFPQIQLHGGSASILDLDPEEGSVTVLLSGACSGCGISPMTVQAIKSRMVKEIPEIESVVAETGEMGEDGDHYSTGGHHPAGGGMTQNTSEDIPEWRKNR